MDKKWLKDEEFWFNERFERAKALVSSVKLVFYTSKREYYDVGGTSVVLGKNLVDFKCTCKECSCFPSKLCEFKLAVLAWRVLK